MRKQGCKIGLMGLGVMGRNLALNLADHDFPVAVYNRTGERTRDFMETEVAGRDIRPGYTVPEFVGLLRRPRALIILVPAYPSLPYRFILNDLTIQAARAVRVSNQSLVINRRGLNLPLKRCSSFLPE